MYALACSPGTFKATHSKSPFVKSKCRDDLSPSPSRREPSGQVRDCPQKKSTALKLAVLKNKIGNGDLIRLAPHLRVP